MKKLLNTWKNDWNNMTEREKDTVLSATIISVSLVAPFILMIFVGGAF